MTEPAVRTVMSTGDARLRTGTRLDWGDLLRQSRALYQTLGLEQYLCKGVMGGKKQKNKRTLGLGVKKGWHLCWFSTLMYAQRMFWEISFSLLPLSPPSSVRSSCHPAGNAGVLSQSVLVGVTVKIWRPGQQSADGPQTFLVTLASSQSTRLGAGVSTVRLGLRPPNTRLMNKLHFWLNFLLKTWHTGPFHQNRIRYSWLYVNLSQLIQGWKWMILSQTGAPVPLIVSIFSSCDRKTSFVIFSRVLQ